MSVFGVDLGSLNSTVAITRYGGVDIVTNEVSKRETTTIISFVDDERFIGEQGLDRYVRNAQNTVFLLKRFIGMRMSDPNLEAEKPFLMCQIKADEKDHIMFGVNYCGELNYFYPAQLLAMILQKLRSYVNSAATVDVNYPANVQDCVITVPSYYTADQRRLMYQAAEVAGVHCMSLINETTAAAVDYGIFRGTTLKETEEEGQIVGILDIGYASTEFVITRFWKGNCKILHRVFDRFCGTRDVDLELYKHMVGEVQQRYHVDVTENRRARLRLLQACERLKYLLSANSSAPLHVENIMDIDINIPSFERTKLEELSLGIVERVKHVLLRGFKDSDIPREAFHSIELIGGGCRIPMFKRLVDEILQRAPSFTLNASETMARGSAIMAAMLSPKFQVREFKMVDLATYPLLLGYYVENPRSPSHVPFLPDVNKVVTLLSTRDAFPKLLDVTIPRKGLFKVYAFYDTENPNVKAAIMPWNYVVGEWEIGAATSKPRGHIREVKVRINLKPDGLIYVESAHAVDYYEVEEKSAPEPTANEESTPSDAKEGEGQVALKTKQRLISVPVTPNLEVTGHNNELIVKFCKYEEEMHKRDIYITQTREKKNELESYILDYRSRFSKDGMLADYIAAETLQKFLKQCDDDERWLYTEEGEHATLEQYNKRVQELRSIGDDANERYRNRDDVQFTFKTFCTRINAAKQCALDKIGKTDHITEEELRQVAATADEALAWGQSEVAALLASPKTQAPTLRPADLETRARKVEAGINAVVNRPAPPPPKKEAPPMEEQQKQQQPVSDTQGNVDPAQQNEEEAAAGAACGEHA